MKFPRSVPHFRSLKFAPFALISLFLFSNLTGLLFSHVLAPVAIASPDPASLIPADMPTSGDPALDRIIFEAGEKEGSKKVTFSTSGCGCETSAKSSLIAALGDQSKNYVVESVSAVN